MILKLEYKLGLETIKWNEIEANQINVEINLAGNHLVYFSCSDRFNVIIIVSVLMDIIWHKLH